VNIDRATQLRLILAAVIATAACSKNDVQHPEAARDRLLDQAFSVAESDPGRAADLFAETGPGPSLEYTRMALWADCLERTVAGIHEWRDYLGDDPPETLASRAHLAVIRNLVQRGAFDAALDERSLLTGNDMSTVDELLFSVDDQKVRLEAAKRLVITRPSFLAAADRKLDRELASRLSPEQRLERATAWRNAGRSARAASELGGRKWSGKLEQRRRHELARAELDSGSPARALNTLPSGGDADAEDHLLRTQALRNRGWHIFPGRNERRYFRDCVTAAETVLALESTPVQRQSALALRLECATQADQLSTALESWRMLEAEHWEDPRRDWLGRRLGVALAQADDQSRAVREIARDLPAQERCLRYWLAVNSSDGGAELEALAEVPVADLYGQWSRQILARSRRDEFDASTPGAVDQPPRSVERLLSAGRLTDALRQWRRIRRARSTTPAEALTASELAAAHGWSTDSIRWLLAAFPELGTVNMTEAPVNAVRAYLPLRWSEAMIAAAKESGIEPWLLAGIARQESGLVAHATSPRGAVGVLQLLPSTARLHAKALGLGSQPDLEDPEINLRLGARELGALRSRFGAVEPALAAYNGGLTRVRGWWRRWPDRRLFTEEIPVPETYNYVRRVVFLSEAYRQVYEEEWRRDQ
jgi:soluble lytic murein transglycosylase